ncbi:methyl-CpG-binding domain protein 3 isoform X1 [Anopheles arabiensis]|uniref:AGAP003982-PB n=2 Tax=gambiae species complex TaxID=44542 RepID=F5HM38_ANOGA|nr:methyl-CpG-binding domain protein 3 isoform X1 [Anopheles arabiensis]XP_040218844.2 methyl-CpG-binding domain protein 3 isoform X1 [Anopheles coluzzii]EGK97349.1 AGAP003982-PB [Anopheles gambiae str. PEST]
MNVSIERKRTDCAALPKGWQREEVLRKTGLSAGKVDVYYYSPTGKKIESKPQLARALGDTIDLSTFDYQAGRIIAPPSVAAAQLLHSHHGPSYQLLQQQANSSSALRRKFPPSVPLGGSNSLTATPISAGCGVKPSSQFDYSRAMRSDTSLIPPIRQTASIFKQPVTVVRSQEPDNAKAKRELQHGSQVKPKQLFWEKRLENLGASNTHNEEIGSIELPKRLRPIGPGIRETTVLQSLATALHHNTLPVTGQTASKTSLNTNAGVFTNPHQPLMTNVTITEEDVKRQEERVQYARLRLQEALRA